MTQFTQATDLVAFASTAPTPHPSAPVTAPAGTTTGTTTGTTVHGPSIGHVFSSTGHLLWNIAGALPGGHWATPAYLLAAGGVGYLQVKFNGGVGAVNGWGSKKEGWADKAEIRENLSAKAMLNNATVLRPSLANVPKNQLAALDVAWLLGKDALYGQHIYSSVEDMTLMFAPPRAGKTVALGNPVIDAPGGAVVTSTRGDIYKHTSGLRSRRGPVFVFNPDLAGIPNTLHWNPVKGCRNPHVAFRRAGYLLTAASSGGVEDQNFWNGQSYRVLRSYLMAADYGNRSLVDVRRWVTSGTDPEPLQILESVPGLPDGWLTDLRMVISAPDKTRDSILLTLIQSLECLALPQVAAIVTPQDGTQDFDPAMFLRARGTLYMLGRHRAYGSVAPLFSMLAGEIYDVAHELAASSVNGRLDPPVHFALDEAAIICPLPIQAWGADAGGSGITLTVSVQSISQLYDRWGLQAGKTIRSLSNTLVLPGLALPEDQDEISRAVGTKDEEYASISTNAKGERTRTTNVREVRIIKPERVRKLKKGTGLYLSRSYGPLIVKITPVWKRADVKAYNAEMRALEKQQARMEKEGLVLDRGTVPPMPAYKPVVPPQQQPQPSQNPWITPQDPHRKAM